MLDDGNEGEGEVDLIKHPPHYTAAAIECWDYIAAWKMDFLSGNIIKYITRAPFKDNELTDLKKARTYLNKLIESKEWEKATKEAEARGPVKARKRGQRKP